MKFNKFQHKKMNHDLHKFKICEPLSATGLRAIRYHQELHENKIEEITKNAGSYANYYPAVWYQNFEGGHIWITALGHAKENYNEPAFTNHLLQGIRFIANEYHGLNYDQAKSISKDDPLKK